MNQAFTQSESIDRILQEHDALRDKVRRIHSTFDEPEPNQSEIEELLREFFSTLRVHFIHEEDELFEEVTSQAPRLAGRAGKLRLEHREMLRDADELCRFAIAGSASMPWWRELSSRCHVFCKRLMQHEHEENQLLQESRKSDIGVYD